MQPTSRRFFLARLAAALVVGGVAWPGRAFAQDVQIFIAPREPPRPRYERIPPLPRGWSPEEAAFEPGYWEWRGNRWYWNRGAWHRRPAGRYSRWVHGRWERHHDGWRRFRGRWVD